MKLLSTLAFIVFILCIGCKDKSKQGWVTNSQDVILDTSISYPTTVAGMYFGLIPDTLKITPVTEWYVEPQFANKVENVYDVLIEGYGPKPAMSIDTFGVITINDSLQTIRTLLWFLKQRQSPTIKIEE